MTVAARFSPPPLQFPVNDFEDPLNYFPIENFLSCNNYSDEDIFMKNPNNKLPKNYDSPQTEAPTTIIMINPFNIEGTQFHD